MAKIQLNSNVTLDIEENGEIKHSFNLTFKELSKKQQKDIGEENEKILDIFKLIQKIDKHINTHEMKAEALKELGNNKDLLTTVKKLDDLYAKKEKLEKDAVTHGGYEKMLEASKITFQNCVSGADVAALEEWIEENSDYGTVLTVISEDARNSKGK